MAPRRPEFFLSIGKFSRGFHTEIIPVFSDIRREYDRVYPGFPDTNCLLTGNGFLIILHSSAGRETDTSRLACICLSPS